MKRREFVASTGCALAALLSPAQTAEAQGTEQAPKEGQTATPAKPKPKGWKVELEIFEARADSWCHKKGDRLAYPEDWGKVCPWLRASLDPFIRLLGAGVTLPWKYEGTRYEKVIDLSGITTEYVRCPDPTADLVVKIIRTAV